MKLQKGLICKNCPLEKELGVTGEGLLPADIVLVGEAPTDSTAGREKAFSGPEGRIIIRAVEDIKKLSPKFERVRIYKCYAVACSGLTWPPNKLAIDHCKTILGQDLRKASPKAIVAFGAVAAKSLGFNFRKYKEIVGQKSFCEIGDKSVPVYFALGGVQVSTDRGLYKLLCEQLKRAFIEAVEVIPAIESIDSLIKTFIYPQTVDEIINVLAEIKDYTREGKPSTRWPISFDTETNTQRPYKPGAKIISMSMAWDDGKATSFVFDHPLFPWPAGYLDRLIAALREFFGFAKPMALHNAKYDLQMTECVYDFFLAGARWDTLLAEHLLDESKKGFYGLEAVVRVYLSQYGDYKSMIPTEFKSKDSVGDQGYLHVPLKYLIPYGALDADFTRRVMKFQFARAKGTGFADQLLYLMTDILIPASRELSKVEYDGFDIDWEKLEDAEKKLTIEIDNLKQASAKLINKEINLDNPIDVSKILFGYYGLPTLKLTASGRKATGKKILARYAEKPFNNDFAKLVINYRAVTRAKHTFLEGLRVSASSDGKAHAEYFINGTECLAKGELVFTNKGYLSVEDVKVGDLVISHTGVPRAVTAVINNGIHQILQVTLENGQSLKTTFNHEYLTTEGWLRADQLIAGNHQALTYGNKEEWKPISKWPDFSVSSWGRILNTKTNRIATQRPKGTWGHLKVCLYRDGAQKRGPDRKDFPVHRLVLETFFPNTDSNKPEVRHLNGIAWDNHLSNLCWGSVLENRADAVKHQSMRNRKPTQRKLSDKLVEEIRAIPKGFLPEQTIANQYGVSRRLIGLIRQGKRRIEPDIIVNKEIKFRISKVKEIKLLPAEPTYGLTVEIDASHITAGIVSHNTGRLSAGGGKKKIKKTVTRVNTKVEREPWPSQKAVKGIKIFQFCPEMSHAEIDKQVYTVLDGLLKEEQHRLEIAKEDETEYQGINSQNYPTELAGVNIKSLLIPSGPLPGRFKHVRVPTIPRSQKVIANLDIAAAEVRILTCYAPDPNLIEALTIGCMPGDTRAPFDIYSFVANDMKGYPYEWVNKGKDLLPTDAHTCPFIKCSKCDFEITHYDNEAFYNIFVNTPCPKCKAPVVSSKCVCKTLAKKLRQIFKAISLSMMYMKTKYGLAKDLEITEAEAEGFIKDFFRRYPLVEEYINATKKEIRDRGWIETFFGRRRRFPVFGLDLESRDKAYREGVNFKIQSTSTDLVIKIGIWLAPEIRALGGAIRNFVHDSITFELEINKLKYLRKILDDIIIYKVLETYKWMRVPFFYDIKVGPDYGKEYPLEEYIARHEGTNKTTTDCSNSYSGWETPNRQIQIL